MNIITPQKLPRFWWINPWRVVRHLHRATNALDELCRDYETKFRCAESSRQHWITKHDRAYAVAMHNQRLLDVYEAGGSPGRGQTPCRQTEGLRSPANAELGGNNKTE